MSLPAPHRVRLVLEGVQLHLDTAHEILERAEDSELSHKVVLGLEATIRVLSAGLAAMEAEMTWINHDMGFTQ